ncbi:hypothetical protein DMUE_1950 [Dictyocoela muelleri]|nr:hypothetical protein DMUE_1950 [Dictyocoela muelleri]
MISLLIILILSQKDELNEKLISINNFFNDIQNIANVITYTTINLEEIYENTLDSELLKFTGYIYGKYDYIINKYYDILDYKGKIKFGYIIDTSNSHECIEKIKLEILESHLNFIFEKILDAKRRISRYNFLFLKNEIMFFQIAKNIKNAQQQIKKLLKNSKISRENIFFEEENFREILTSIIDHISSTMYIFKRILAQNNIITIISLPIPEEYREINFYFDSIKDLTTYFINKLDNNEIFYGVNPEDLSFIYEKHSEIKNKFFEIIDIYSKRDEIQKSIFKCLDLIEMSIIYMFIISQEMALNDIKCFKKPENMGTENFSIFFRNLYRIVKSIIKIFLYTPKPLKIYMITSNNDNDTTIKWGISDENKFYFFNNRILNVLIIMKKLSKDHYFMKNCILNEKMNIIQLKNMILSLKEILLSFKNKLLNYTKEKPCQYKSLSIQIIKYIENIFNPINLVISDLDKYLNEFDSSNGEV